MVPPRIHTIRRDVSLQSMEGIHAAQVNLFSCEPLICWKISLVILQTTLPFRGFSRRPVPSASSNDPSLVVFDNIFAQWAPFGASCPLAWLHLPNRRQHRRAAFWFHQTVERERRRIFIFSRPRYQRVDIPVRVFPYVSTHKTNRPRSFETRVTLSNLRGAVQLYVRSSI